MTENTSPISGGPDTGPQPSTTSGPGPALNTGSAVDRLFASIRQTGLVRDTNDRWLAGVCSGVAHKLNVDPLLIRAALIVSLFFGVGFVVYVLLWSFLPKPDGRISAEDAIRHGDGGGLVLLVVLALLLFGSPIIIGSNDGWWGLGPLIVVGAIAYYLVKRPSRATPPQSYAPSSGQPTATSYAAAAVPAYAAQPQSPMANQAPVYAPPSSPVYAPPPPPRPIRRGAGAAAGLLTLGAAVMAFGVGLVLPTPTVFQDSAFLFGLLLSLLTVGTITLVTGLVGRRATAGILITLLLALIAVPATLANSSTWTSGTGDRAWLAAPTANGAFTLGAGTATLDLRRVSAGERVEVSLGAGELDLIVDPSAAYTLNSQIGGGELTITDATGEIVRTKDGLGFTDTYHSTSTATTGTSPDGADRPITIDAHVGFGTITVRTS